MNTRAALLVLLLGTVTACAGTLQTASITEAYNKYERGNYAATLKLISRAENARAMFPEQKAEVTYLKALTYEKLGEQDLAETLYRYIEEQHASSQYAYLARSRLRSGQ